MNLPPTKKHALLLQKRSTKSNKQLDVPKARIRNYNNMLASEQSIQEDYHKEIDVNMLSISNKIQKKTSRS